LSTLYGIFLGIDGLIALVFSLRFPFWMQKEVWTLGYFSNNSKSKIWFFRAASASYRCV